MARGDPFNPGFSDMLDGATAVWDGSASSTNAAIISELAGNQDAEVRIQESNDGGSNWTTISQLENESGNLTFTADWHSQFNRILVEQDKRRVQITNIGGSQGQFSVSGDER